MAELGHGLENGGARKRTTINFAIDKHL